MAKLVFTPETLLSACAVLREKPRFTPGFDKMTPAAAETWLKLNGEQLSAQLNAGKYRAMPAVGFSTAKQDGKYRRLARLTAVDTIVQIAALEQLNDHCAGLFSRFSFAYQKGRGVGDALNQYCRYAAEYPYAAKVDPTACFDHIDHAILKKALDRFFFCRKTVDLLMDFARMPVIVEGELTDRRAGILQGAPVSGMLCNVYFHSLDAELSAKEIPFVRYADDVVVFASTPEEAQERYRFVCSYFKNALRLQVNEKKSGFDAAEELRFLGHSFFRGDDGVMQIDAGEKKETVYYEWNSLRPINQRGGVDVVSSGILRQKDFSAVFESEAQELSIPLGSIDRVNVFSSVVFDSGFLAKMSQAGVFVNVFDRNYDYLGRFVPATSIRDQRLIYEQLAAYNDPLQRLALAKEFDLASVHNLRLNIRYYNKQHENGIYKKALNKINNLFTEMKACETCEQLLLIEAQVREAYYACYDAFIQNKVFSFGARSRRPPLNAVNSLLSFGNVVLYNYVATQIHKSALDIRIGFLHATNRRAESLNLDVAEIFKPLIVDRTVFTLVNRKELDLSFFTCEENGGVYLNEEGKRKFLRAFYEKLNTTLQIKESSLSYAALIDEELRKLTARFRRNEEYKAYRQVR